MRRKSIVIAACCISVVVAAGAFVLADRLYGAATGIDQVRHWAQMFRSEVAPYGLHASAFRPNVDDSFERAAPESGFRVRTNESGTIIGSEEIERAATTILFLGGSTTECNEIDEPDRFPAVVQTLLRQWGGDVRTINAGVRGHTTQDSMLAYLSRPRFREAQIVVMMHNINDRLWLAHFGNYSTPQSDVGATTWANVGRSADEAASALWDAVSYRSSLLFAVRQRVAYFNPWNGERIPTGAVSVEADQSHPSAANLNTFAANLRAFVALVRSQGAIPVLMTQPLGTRSEAQTVFNARIQETALAEHVQVIDLATAVADKPPSPFLEDQLHLNDSGSRAVGISIAHALAPGLHISQPD